MKRIVVNCWFAVFIVEMSLCVQILLVSNRISAIICNDFNMVLIQASTVQDELTHQHRRSTGGDDPRAVQASRSEKSSRQFGGQQALALDLLELHGAQTGRRIPAFTSANGTIQIGCLERRATVSSREMFIRLADRPLLAKLKHLAVCGKLLGFDLNELNKFSQLVHLEINAVWLDKKSVNLNLSVGSGVSSVQRVSSGDRLS